MLKQRIITALLLGPLLLAIVIYGNLYWFLLLVGVIQTAATFEWLKINKIKAPLALINGIVITVLTLFLWHQLTLDVKAWFWLYVVIWVLALLWLLKHQWGYQNTTIQLLIKGVLGALAILLFSLSMIQLFNLEQGNWWTLSLFLLIWVADIGAYISGKTFGKHKLAVNISPGKTWEGVIGAQILVAVYAIVVSQFLAIEWTHAVMIMVPIALFSVVGDLAASLGKRQAKIKDSSNLLPGHGGFIDRFDSLIAAAPLYFILLNYL
ncbi:phosphatidate cytidylyltransferase [Marinicella litoralis]|uniref:Phosphatidate cytidylyltransferase n=2 Tax=Marinicella litoralis TaxID=644220 RepID=A0A4R6XP04_9GAMM|nr:phosphatidate cytidylyltransferase [Marinicella litoralis]